MDANDKLGMEVSVDIFADLGDGPKLQSLSGSEPGSRDRGERLLSSDGQDLGRIESQYEIQPWVENGDETKFRVTELAGYDGESNRTKLAAKRRVGRVPSSKQKHSGSAAITRKTGKSGESIVEYSQGFQPYGLTSGRADKDENLWRMDHKPSKSVRDWDTFELGSVPASLLSKRESVEVWRLRLIFAQRRGASQVELDKISAKIEAAKLNAKPEPKAIAAAHEVLNEAIGEFLKELDVD